MYRIMDRIGKKTLQIIFVGALILLILFIGMGTVIPEFNRHTYKGVVVEKYKENHSFSTGKTQFIELEDKQHNTVKIENTDILLRGKFDSKAKQQSIQEGKEATVYTIGFDLPQFGIHPNSYKIDQ